MFFADELYVQALLADRAREADALLAARTVQRLLHAMPPLPVWPASLSAGERVQQLLSELYGPGQPFGDDPALFTRLAWVGIDV